MKYATLIALLTGALFASDNVAPGINRFATTAYQDLAHGNDNLILSPFSVSTALSMLLDGARGDTAAGIAKTIAQLRSGADYDAAVAALSKQLQDSANTEGNQLAIANGLWVQRGFSILPDFDHTIRTVYSAPLTPLDFEKDPARATDAINNWTSEHTKGRIAKLFAPGAVNSDTRLVLTSAIYFYGTWRTPFDPSETSPQTFHPADGNPIQTDFMYKKTSFLYNETPSMQILEMRYAGTPLAFDILLPKSADGFKSLERSLDPKLLASWFTGLSRQTVEVVIPKFRAESSFSLKAVLSRMGMGEAFGRAADFSGIDGRRDLLLSDVKHKAFVEVTEKGTEAAAATGGTVQLLAMRRAEHTVFRADHPFVYFIRDTSSGAILFEGRLMNPKS